LYEFFDGFVEEDMEYSHCCRGFEDIACFVEEMTKVRGDGVGD
jgi:hypothetical protein